MKFEIKNVKIIKKLKNGKKMDKEFRNFIEEISKKTNNEIGVYDESGNYLYGKNEKTISAINFADVFVDCPENKTYFKLKYKNKTYIAEIDGSDSEAQGFAYLIAKLSETSYGQEKTLTKDEFYRKLLLGNFTYYEISKYMKEYVLSDREVFSMLITCPSGREEEIIEVLNSYTQDENDHIIRIEEGKLVLIKFIDEEVEEYRSVKEYGEFLYQSINEITGIHAGVYIGSTVKSVSDIGTSFSQAVIAERIGKEFYINGHVHFYKEYSLIEMLEELPKNKLNEYLSILSDPMAKEVFEDKEMLITAEEFLENSLNISETSRKMYLHRNTLTYRLDKIEKTTGLDLRKFSDALTFRIIMILSKLVG